MRFWYIRILIVLSLAIFVLACQNRAEKKAVPEKTSVKKTEIKKAANHDHDAHKGHDHAAHKVEPKHEGEHKKEDGHHEHEEEVTDPKAADLKVLTVPESGAIHLGAKFSDGVKVDLKTLLKAPEKYLNKKIRVSGLVKAFCHHKRSWFAIVNSDNSPGYVTVYSFPVFKVPEGVMNVTADVEGVVEKRMLKVSRLKHFSEGHKLKTNLLDNIGDKTEVEVHSIKVLGAAFKK